MVPSTPTSTSGAFWKGSELGSEPQAQPAAPSSTSEVVKSKSAGHPARGGHPCSISRAQWAHHCSPNLVWNPPPPTPSPDSEKQAWGRGGRGKHPGARPVGVGWKATLTHCPPWLRSPGEMVGDQADRLLALLPRGAHRLPHRHAASPLPRQLLGVGRRGGLHPAPGGPGYGIGNGNHGNRTRMGSCGLGEGQP